jgi:hypothetical protein
MLSLLIGERLRGGKSFPGYFVLSEEYSGRALRASAAGDADGMVINLFAPVAGEAKKAPPTYRPCGKLYFDPKRRLLYQYVLEDGKLLRRYSLVVSSPTFEFGEEKYRVPRRVLVSAGGDVLYVFARLEEAGSVTALVGQGWYQQHLFEQPGCPFIKERLALPDPPPREGLDSFAGGQVGNGRVAARLFGEDTT